MDSALYCVRAKVRLACQCCRGRQAETRNPEQAHNAAPVMLSLCSCVCSSSGWWRPWVMTARDAEKQRPSSRGCESPSETRRPLGFQHPVRLYLPRSKAEHYLHHMGEKVLASFPVQATIHFYNDDSDTEEEEEEEDELMSCGSESENTPETARLFWKQ
ncbi:protein ripply3 isoform X1 [Hemiscyllium ocellatum]|uniref:protein ripply3 isoform X1 n=1 Tax=Hemiscyllium ocellatum TaxID=170820 RepID=UPI002965D187|nr:protein ripply3 isoform X1 [Hemiscyllium ocellatum]